MSDERGSIGTSLVLFLAGAAVGAAVVALLTPKSGPELRADLRDMGGKVKDKLAHIKECCCPGEGKDTQGGEVS
nr:YtxH domain-containing protein [uncultured Holophaga sp.]